MTTLVQGGLIGRLTPRIDEPHLVVVGTALLAIGLGAVPFTPPVAPLLLALAAIACRAGDLLAGAVEPDFQGERGTRARWCARRLAVGRQPGPHPGPGLGRCGVRLRGIGGPVRHHGAADAGGRRRGRVAGATRTRGADVVAGVRRPPCRPENFLLSSPLRWTPWKTVYASCRRRASRRRSRCSAACCSTTRRSTVPSSCSRPTTSTARRTARSCAP